MDDLFLVCCNMLMMPRNAIFFIRKSGTYRFVPSTYVEIFMRWHAIAVRPPIGTKIISARNVCNCPYKSVLPYT
jgi:hypothetical protein